MSLAACSRASGKSRTYLKRVAALSNISVGNQNSSYSKALRNSVIRSASKGQSIATIAKAQGLLESSVCSIISLTPGLVQKRRKYRISQARVDHREVLKAFLAEHPECIRRDIVSRLNKSFHWLYRNDKDWLYRHLPAKTVPQPNPRVDWHKRDKHVGKEILKAKKAGLHFRNWVEADRYLGERDWFPRYKGKLPKSTRFLSTMIN